MKCWRTPVFFGRQYRGGYTVLPRHQHKCSYAALVLSGGYEEAGDRGRFRVRAGDILLHGPFEAHVNRYGPVGSEVLTLALAQFLAPRTVLMRSRDPDSVVRLAERDSKEAADFLLDTMVAVHGHESDWPDHLAAALRSDPQLRIGDWARAHDFADATVSRGFRKVFGVTPSVYRAQLRGTLAWRQCFEGNEELCSIAFRCGFSDQAHMTRRVHDLTGKPPSAWRRAGQLNSRHDR